MARAESAKLPRRKIIAGSTRAETIIRNGVNRPLRRCPQAGCDGAALIQIKSTKKFLMSYFLWLPKDQAILCTAVLNCCGRGTTSRPFGTLCSKATSSLPVSRAREWTANVLFWTCGWSPLSDWSLMATLGNFGWNRNRPQVVPKAGLRTSTGRSGDRHDNLHSRPQTSGARESTDNRCRRRIAGRAQDQAGKSGGGNHLCPEIE